MTVVTEVFALESFIKPYICFVCFLHLCFILQVIFKRITIECYEHLHAKKFNNLDEIDKFLEKHNLLKLTQNEIQSLNSLICIKEIEFVIKNLPIKKTPGLIISLINSIKY